MTLGEYLSSAARRRWDWGGQAGDDCCTFMAGWVIARGHPDPMAFIRGRYDSERSAIRRIEDGGGLVALWRRGMGEAGLAEVRGDPRAGDVAVLDLPTEEGVNLACGIFSGERWVTRTLNGVEAGPAVSVAAWRP